MISLLASQAGPSVSGSATAPAAVSPVREWGRGLSAPGEVRRVLGSWGGDTGRGRGSLVGYGVGGQR